MDIRDYRPEDGRAIDLENTVTSVCVCGSNMWWAVVSFEDGELSSYFLDIQCFECGTRAKAPTPID